MYTNSDRRKEVGVITTLLRKAHAGGVNLENLEDLFPGVNLDVLKKAITDFAALKTVPINAGEGEVNCVVVTPKYVQKVKDVSKLMDRPGDYTERIDAILTTMRKGLPQMRYQTDPALKGCNTGC